MGNCGKIDGKYMGNMRIIGLYGVSIGGKTNWGKTHEVLCHEVAEALEVFRAAIGSGQSSLPLKPSRQGEVKCEMLNQNESMRQSSLFKELLQESAKGHVPWVAWHAINTEGKSLKEKHVRLSLYDCLHIVPTSMLEKESCTIFKECGS
jgi:hypothetical protein